MGCFGKVLAFSLGVPGLVLAAGVVARLAVEGLWIEASIGLFIGAVIFGGLWDLLRRDRPKG